MAATSGTAQAETWSASVKALRSSAVPSSRHRARARTTKVSWRVRGSLGRIWPPEPPNTPMATALATSAANQLLSVTSLKLSAASSVAPKARTRMAASWARVREPLGCRSPSEPWSRPFSTAAVKGS